MNFFGLAHKVPSQRKFVVAIVERNRAAAIDCFVLTPSPRRGRNFPPRPTDAGIALDADSDEIADGALINEGFRFHDRGIENKILKDFERLLRFRLSAGNDLIRLGKISSHRLLQGDMLARIERRNRRFAMQVMRKQNLNRIDARIVEQRSVVPVDASLSTAPGPGARRCLLDDDIGDCDDFSIRIVAVLDRVKIGYAPSPDDPYPDLVYGLPHHALSRLLAAEFCVASPLQRSRTSLPKSSSLEASIRAVGPERPMAATIVPASSKIGAATQRTPGLNSSSSLAKPRRRVSTISASRRPGSTIVRSVCRVRSFGGAHWPNARYALPRAVQWSGASAPTGWSTRSGCGEDTLSTYQTLSRTCTAMWAHSPEMSTSSCSKTCVASRSAIKPSSSLPSVRLNLAPSLYPRPGPRSA